MEWSWGVRRSERWGRRGQKVGNPLQFINNSTLYFQRVHVSRERGGGGGKSHIKNRGAFFKYFEKNPKRH